LEVKQILLNRDGELDSDLISKLLAITVIFTLILIRGLGPLLGAAPESLPGLDTIGVAMGWAAGHGVSYAVKRGQGSHSGNSVDPR
jgi:hypothetical protein